MRGAHRSTPVEELIEQARSLAAKGVRELILIAQDLTYYGLDLYKKRALAELLRGLCTVEGIDWIRLHYAFPTGFPMDVLEVMRTEPKICNYIDIPLQHISDPILKSMRRGTTRAKTDALLDSFREKVPGMAIRTTLIVGYPGETEADFEQLREWVRTQRFERLGCFTYSHEEQTHAFTLEDTVPETVKQERANEIMAIQSQISWEANQEKIGGVYKCMIDRLEGGYFIGRTEFDSPDVDNEVLVDASQYYLRLGEFAELRITEASDFDLYAEPVEEEA
jgi:ribosomal protein S12 methylthiotransferase